MHFLLLFCHFWWMAGAARQYHPNKGSLVNRTTCFEDLIITEGTTEVLYTFFTPAA
jgi:hypothetical protein